MQGGTLLTARQFATFLKSFNLLFLCKFVKSTMLYFPNSPIFSISAIYMDNILALSWKYSTVYGLAPLMLYL